MTAVLHFHNADARQRTAYSAHAGRRPGRTAGSWVTDLAELGKAIQLCGSCRPAFNAARYGYEAAARPPLRDGVWSNCDGCKARHVLCTNLLPVGQF